MFRVSYFALFIAFKGNEASEQTCPSLEPGLRDRMKALVRPHYPACVSLGSCIQTPDQETSKLAVFDLLGGIATMLADGCTECPKEQVKELPDEWRRFYCDRCRPEVYVPVTEADLAANRRLQEERDTRAEEQRRACRSLARVNELVSSGYSRSDAWETCKAELSAERVITRAR
jgi:hypothetical protein